MPRCGAEGQRGRGAEEQEQQEEQEEQEEQATVIAVRRIYGHTIVTPLFTRLLPDGVAMGQPMSKLAHQKVPLLQPMDGVASR